MGDEPGAEERVAEDQCDLNVWFVSMKFSKNSVQLYFLKKKRKKSSSLVYNSKNKLRRNKGTRNSLCYVLPS